MKHFHSNFRDTWLHFSSFDATQNDKRCTEEETTTKTPKREYLRGGVHRSLLSLYPPDWLFLMLLFSRAVLWVQVLVKVMRPRAVFAESISNSLINSMHMRMGCPGLPVQPDGNVSQYQRFAPKQLKWTHKVLCFLTTLIEVPEF